MCLISPFWHNDIVAAPRFLENLCTPALNCSLDLCFLQRQSGTLCPVSLTHTWTMLLLHSKYHYHSQYSNSTQHSPPKFRIDIRCYRCPVCIVVTETSKSFSYRMTLPVIFPPAPYKAHCC